MQLLRSLVHPEPVTQEPQKYSPTKYEQCYNNKDSCHRQIPPMCEASDTPTITPARNRMIVLANCIPGNLRISILPFYTKITQNFYSLKNACFTHRNFRCQHAINTLPHISIVFYVNLCYQICFNTAVVTIHRQIPAMCGASETPIMIPTRNRPTVPTNCTTLRMSTTHLHEAEG